MAKDRMTNPSPVNVIEFLKIDLNSVIRYLVIRSCNSMAGLLMTGKINDL